MDNFDPTTVFFDPFSHGSTVLPARQRKVANHCCHEEKNSHSAYPKCIAPTGAKNELIDVVTGQRRTV